jgi:hypothetical protein
MVLIRQRGQRRRLGHGIHIKGLPHLVQQADARGRSHRIPDAQAGQPIGLGEGAQNKDAAPLQNQGSAHREPARPAAARYTPRPPPPPHEAAGWSGSGPGPHWQPGCPWGCWDWPQRPTRVGADGRPHGLQIVGEVAHGHFKGRGLVQAPPPAYRPRRPAPRPRCWSPSPGTHGPAGPESRCCRGRKTNGSPARSTRRARAWRR